MIMLLRELSVVHRLIHQHVIQPCRQTNYYVVLYNQHDWLGDSNAAAQIEEKTYEVATC